MSSPDIPVLRRDLYTSCMSNLDKLPWVAGFAESAFGVNYGVRVNDPDLIPLLKQRLPLRSKPSNDMVADCMFSVVKGGREGGLRKFNLLYWNHRRMKRSHQLDDVLHAFESFSRLGVGRIAPDRVFVHAGVVAWKGRAILLPGRTFTGKTTLVSELVKAGASYLSDEYAILTSDGMVEGYPKPLSMRTQDGKPQGEWPVESLGGHIEEGPLEIGLVVFSKYRKSATWSPKRISSGQAALELLKNTVSARHAPQFAMNAIANALINTETVESRRNDAAETAPRIIEKAEMLRKPVPDDRGASKEINEYA